MKKLVRISILVAIMAGVLVYVLTPNDAAIYFGQNGPSYGDLASRSVGDPNRSDAPYLGMNHFSSSNISVSSNGPRIRLQSSGSYVNKETTQARVSRSSMTSGSAMPSHSARSNGAVAANVSMPQMGNVIAVRTPNLVNDNKHKRIADVDNVSDDVVETGDRHGVDIHGGGPSVGGNDSHSTPIGDALFPLSLLLLIFVAFKRFK